MQEVIGRAFCLGHTQLTDHRFAVHFFSAEHGLVKGVVRLGAGRTFTKAILTPFVEVELTLSGRQHQDLKTVQQLDCIDQDILKTSDYLRLSLIHCWAELLMRIQPPHQQDERVFRLADHARKSLNLAQSAPVATRLHLYFEFWLLRLNGFLPPVHEPWRRSEMGLASGPDRDELDTGLMSVLNKATKLRIEQFSDLALEWSGLKGVFALFGELFKQQLNLELKARRSLMALLSEQQ
ncbi:MAG: recombination protein O N-terminal domain-containing protein [Acidobacteria bacterium]|nr:recombination protein O N-terminal domain-containing protein [Acidobacteriota bacterium]